jgi:lipopolysaccharide export system protein LptA
MVLVFVGAWLFYGFQRHAGRGRTLRQIMRVIFKYAFEVPLNIPRNCIILPLTLALLLFVPKIGFSQAAEEKPIEITSERMRSEEGGKKIIFSGNVISAWDDLKITSDILEIYNSEDKKETNEIIALGNVVITRGTKKAKGDRAIYLNKQQKIILTGSPNATAWDDKNTIHGKEMIFLLDKDRFVVNDRVHMTIFPKGNESNAKRNKKIWVDAKK